MLDSATLALPALLCSVPCWRSANTCRSGRRVEKHILLCQSNGGNSFHQLDEDSLWDVGLVSTQGCHPVRISPSRTEQPDCGLGIQGGTDISGMEAEGGVIPQDLCVSGPLQNRPLIATWLNNQLDRYISWRPDPGAILTDAFQTSWKEL